MSTEREIERALKEPFPPEDLEWRVQQCGVKDGRPWAMVLTYINARAIMDRLDEVVGPKNWSARYTKQDTGFLCDLAVRVDGEWIVKSDGSDATDIEPFKGGISGAIKRAAVLWGIGRYLYRLDSGFARCSKEKFHGSIKGYHKETKTEFYWSPPELPEWALPSDATQNKITKEATDKNQERLKRYIAGRQEAKDRKDPEPAEKKPGSASGVSAKAEREARAREDAQKIKETIINCDSVDALKGIWIAHELTLRDLPIAIRDDVIKAKDEKKKKLLGF
jgi:hypothetical protein